MFKLIKPITRLNLLNYKHLQCMYVYYSTNHTTYHMLPITYITYIHTYVTICCMVSDYSYLMTENEFDKWKLCDQIILYAQNLIQVKFFFFKCIF